MPNAEAILADLESLIVDTRACLDVSPEKSRLALVHLANARECLRAVVERGSIPPGVFEANQQTRKTASEHFREARRIARGIK